MPTSLGIMQIFFGPPPPPPPCDGCWPTPHPAAIRANATSTATLATLNLHAGLDTLSPPSRYALLSFTYSSLSRVRVSPPFFGKTRSEIGRASCRERV